MLSRSERKLLRGLHRRKTREAEGLFLAEGVRTVEELVASSVVLRLALVSERLRQTERGRALERALEAACGTRDVDDGTLEALAGTETPQGVLVAAETPVRELASIEVAGAATVLVLDAVQDPGNVGTLVRTAEAFGAAFIAVLPGTADPWNAKVVRAAAGSSFRVPIVRAGPDALVEWLHARGFAIIGADAAGEPIDAHEPPQRAALAVGNEGAGLGPTLADALDARVAVPIRGPTESLNVAVAAGILLYLLSRSG